MRRSVVVVLPGLLLLVTACGREEPRLAWGDLFVASDSTALSLSSLADVMGTIRATPEDPWRVQGINSSARFLWTTVHGATVALSVMGVPEVILETPYWTGWFEMYGAVSEGRIFAATNLTYPIRVYDRNGLLRDSLTTSPLSWRQARRPQVGEFASQVAGRIREYHRTYTMITGLAALSDSLLIVAHGRYEPDSGAFHARWRWDVGGGRHTERAHDLAVRTTQVDVYVGRERVITDHPSPGEIVAYAPDVVLFLTQDTEDPLQWRVVEYSWRGGS